MNRTIWIVLLVLSSVVIGIVLGWYMHQGYLARAQLAHQYEIRDECQKVADQTDFPEGRRLLAQDAKWFLIDNREKIAEASTEMFGFERYSTGGSGPNLMYRRFLDFICIYNDKSKRIIGIRAIYPAEDGFIYFAAGRPDRKTRTYFISSEE